MFKLERLFTFVYILLLNLCYVTSSLSDFIDLLKTVEEDRIECVHRISKSGVYSFKSDPRLPLSRCHITLEVSGGSMAFVRPSERTCETTSSANVSAMCDRPHQEEQLRAGEHHFLFDASESVTISVHITPIITLGCDEWAKNLFDLVDHTIILESNSNNKPCMIQLPPSLEITWLNYESTNRKKPCCPDVFVVSSDFAQNPIAVSESFSACDLRTNRPTIVTRCEATFMYLRQSAKNDRIFFRIQARHKRHMDDCVLNEEEMMEPSNFTCIKKPKQIRTRSKLTFV